ncbi:MAG: leucyl aminopeptidase [Ignavibacteriae bacterium]|nr:MAG: leucyl aminopeptidase [Ignavibacteriota bacterium]
MALTKLDKASIIAIKDCMGAKKKEKILVVTDENKREIGQSLYKNALYLGHEAFLLEMKSKEYNGEEPPKFVAEAMKMADVVLCPTTKSLTHTDARRNASALGKRIATFPGITKEVMIRGLNTDYKKIAALTLKLTKMMDKTKTIRITAPGGTDITMSINGRKAIPSKGLFHKKGESGNLPTGEAFAAPMEGTTEGVFVADGSFAVIGVLKTPIKIKVEKGLATEITGGKEAKQLIKMLEPFGKKGRNIAEIGIGTNDSVKLSGLLLEDEKKLGTVHIALGDNKSMGGKINVPIHVDGVILKPTVYFDDKVIMEKGKMLVKL